MNIWSDLVDCYRGEESRSKPPCRFLVEISIRTLCKVPFAFTAGYENAAIPKSYGMVAVLQKAIRSI
jgi:hypothetical protein